MILCQLKAQVLVTRYFQKHFKILYTFLFFPETSAWHFLYKIDMHVSLMYTYFPFFRPKSYINKMQKKTTRAKHG